MKNKFTKQLVNYGLLIVMVAMVVDQSVKAQALSYGLRANIPFAFSVGNTQLPAGKYSVSRVLPSGEGVIEINSLGGKASALRTTIPVITGKPKDKATLVFHRYGDQYFLFQVWAAGVSTGLTFPLSRSERELQGKQTESMGLASMQPQEPEVVNVVADLP
jgi:hypothetical protein